MNKTVTINIGGFVFHIDDIAFEKLSNYLNTIKGYFKENEGRDEIIGDIEARIAEMFREKTANIRQVINIKDVDEVIAVMGQPEAFAESAEAGAEFSGAETEPAGSRKKRRRIFRDGDDKVMGGVCSGISAYFDIDPIILRLIFAIAFFVFGTGFLLYLILWVIIPEAKTTAEKLEMRGENVTVSNIEKTIRDEMNDLKERLNKISDEKVTVKTISSSSIGNAIRSFLGFIASFIKLLLKFIGKIIGAAFLFVGTILLVIIIALLFGMPGFVNISDHGYEASLTLHQIISGFLGGGQSEFWATLGIALVIAIPLLGLIISGAKILFGIRGRNKYMATGLALLWTVGIIICFAVGMKVSNDFKSLSKHTSDFQITKPENNKMLQLEVAGYDKDMENRKTKVGKWWVVTDEEQPQLFCKPEFDIEKSNNDSIVLEVTRYARGKSRKDATSNAEQISYKFSQQDSVLKLDNYMALGNNKWRAQDIRMVLKLPVGQTVYLHENMKEIIYDIGNITNTWDSDMVNRRWIMTQNGLACVDCDNLKNIGGNDDDEDWETEESDAPVPPEPPVPPAPPAKPKKQKYKTEANATDTGITKEQYELLSKLNRMYLELKQTDTSNQVL